MQVATGVSQVSAGGFHSLFLKSNGTLWAMGSNDEGQLGDGTTTAQSLPVQVATGVSQVSAGGLHSLFLKNDSSLWAMGWNEDGELGDGTTTDRSIPVKIATGVSQVSAGGLHSLFLKSDGTLWAMGRNEDGQLGDGTTTGRSTPVQVAPHVAQVAAGRFHTLFLQKTFISGTVTYSGSPLCAMVLANGQYMFTCGADLGMFDLEVPLDTNGEITLYGFCSGFSPFKAILTPDQALNVDINMTRAASDSREIEMTFQTEAGITNQDWVRIRGTTTYDGTPLCAMILTNGQNMFSCGADLGTFDLEVPLDVNGEITLYCFSSGFAPYKAVFAP